MLKNSESLRLFSNKLVIAIPILFVAYFVYLRFFPYLLPLSTDLGIIRSFPLGSIVGFIMLFLALIFSDYSIVVRIIVFLPSAYFCGLISLIFLFSLGSTPEEIYTSTEFGDWHYHITTTGVPTESWMQVNVYRCNSHDMACERIFYELGGSTVYSAGFIVDDSMGEVHVLHDGHLVFTDGFQPREIHWYEELNDSIYTIGSFLPYGSSSDRHTYVLHKCESSYKSCQQLPFKYIYIDGSINITFDESTDELKIYLYKSTIGDVLIYSYGTEPKCYVEECSIPVE